MKQFVVFDSTGRILRCGLCQDHLVAAQAVNEGELAMEGQGNDLQHYVSLAVPGKPVVCRKLAPDKEDEICWSQ